MNFEYLEDKVPNVSAQLLMPDYPSQNIEAEIVAFGDNYCIILDLEPQSLEVDALGQIHISFDTYFVPKDIGVSQDETQLVIRAPTTIELLKNRYARSEAGPSQYPLITVDSPLRNAIGLDPIIKTPPWSVEIYDNHSFLWLGHGESEGVAGTLWSDVARQVGLEFEVSPGPSRADQQRTVQLVTQHNGQATTQRETFDKLVVLTFPVQLQPGRNDFHFTVLDEATIPVDEDTRPLLVFLRHIKVKSLSGLR
jgi:hypothetical protein